eukprot:5543410-Lingulodinium_polyedra.AAC.1
MEKMQDSNRAKAFLEDEYIHDLGSSQPHGSLNKCMALTKCRCSSSYGYLRLNGVLAKRFATWPNY